ncbi:hypothetical protein HKBW3C_01907 [Candidatus Hakubella thermalkaliphila]|nr:hypothetical protein HKBW3C_01907 [Candidatus Hakubella thermalkaliphila]
MRVFFFRVIGKLDDVGSIIVHDEDLLVLATTTSCISHIDDLLSIRRDGRHSLAAPSIGYLSQVTAGKIDNVKVLTSYRAGLEDNLFLERVSGRVPGVTPGGESESLDILAIGVHAVCLPVPLPVGLEEDKSSIEGPGDIGVLPGMSGKASYL